MNLKKVFLAVLLIILSLTSISCAIAQKQQITIDKWQQLSDGTLSVDFTVTNKSKDYWNYVEIGFSGQYENGACVAYGTVYDLSSGATKTGNATSTYAQGHVITNVKVYSIQTGQLQQ